MPTIYLYVFNLRTMHTPHGVMLCDSPNTHGLINCDILWDNLRSRRTKLKN